MGPVSLAQFLPTNVFGALLIFTRIGTAMMLLPGFGEVYVPQRYRLLLAAILSMLLLPILQPMLPALPSRPSELVLLLAAEAAVGTFIGTLSRIVLSALDTAGQIVSIQTGLANALVFNPLQATQSSVPSTLYGVVGVLLIVLTDTHHLMLRGLLDSYMIFKPGQLPPIGDLSQTVAHAAAGSFRLALEMAAPFVVLGTIFFVALGLIGRLVPQIQVLFVSQPLQILGGLLIFALVISTGMSWFLDALVQQFNIIVPS